ncbi:hypothetical protein [Streptomyces sp. NBC_00356]|uniref:hypothetical protein n=1 Tax=Streptomyces sp. NBC_00356 TaxID=2975724 RepID=UPI002E25C92F
MHRPVTGEVHVSYGQIYVVSEHEDQPDLDETFAGQASGLCGAAVPGFLWLVTGLHTGDVGFTVEVHDREPPVDPVWEDIVEVSFRPLSGDSCLQQWAGERDWLLGLEETDYRVRYSGRGMDRGHELDTRVEGDVADHYLLQFWPATPQPDGIVRQTSQIAAYWHGVARETPPERVEGEGA